MAVESTHPAPARSVAAGLVAALLPILALACAGALLVVLFDGALFEPLMGAAPLGFAVLGVAGTAVLVLGVLLFFAGWRGTPVPAGVLVGIASGPWLMGVLATLASAVRVRGAVPFASPDMRANLVGAGTSEALFGVTAGAWLSGALLVACGLGLAIAALARRHEGPVPLIARLWPALVAGATAIATLALVFIYRDAFRGWLLALPALLVAALAVALAAAFVGRDGRSGAQAAGASFASLLGVTGSLLAVRAHSIAEALHAAVMAAPASRATFVALGLGSSVLGMDLVLFVGLALGVAVVLVAALALARSPRRGPLVAGGLATLLTACVILGIDRYVEASLREGISEATTEPWDQEEGFLPARGGGLDVEDAPHALVTREELVPHAGDPVALSDTAALDASLTRLREGGPPRWTDRPEAPPIDDRWQELLEIDDPPELDDAGVVVEPELVLAFDARVERSRWGAVLAAAARAGFHSVSLLGQHTPEVEAVLARDPVWMRLARGPVERERVLLEAALRTGAAERDPILWHGAIDATDALRIERRGGEDPQRFAYGRVDWRDRDRLEDALVYLRPGDDVSPSRLLEAARLVRELGGRPVLVMGEHPGHPERALAPPAPEAGDDRTRARISVGAVEDEQGTGLFDSAIVTRAIRTRARAIQSCYERELAHTPTLAGRVLVRFTVQPSGAVTGVTATENTTGSPAVAACATSTISRLRFNPGPEGGSVTFAYPFVFAPQPPD